MRQIGEARVVMLGESTHGTHEFYRERMRITQRLIQDKGFFRRRHRGRLA
jgi:erythromycin esterase-like protein